MILRTTKRSVVTLALGILFALQPFGYAASKATPTSPAQKKTPTRPTAKPSSAPMQQKGTTDQGAQQVRETVQIEPGQNDTPENQARVSRLANDAVAKIEAAQAAIDQSNLSGAKMQLGQAQEYLENIQETGPTARVIDKVQTTRKALETSQIQTMDLVPLESELVEFEKFTPAPEARKHLLLAQNSLQNKNRVEASQHLSEVEDRLIYAEADLPVSRTKQDVLGAQTLLQQNKPKEAKKLLTDSLKHIQMLTMETDRKTGIDTHAGPGAHPAPSVKMPSAGSPSSSGKMPPSTHTLPTPASPNPGLTNPKPAPFGKEQAPSTSRPAPISPTVIPSKPSATPVNPIPKQ